MKGMEGVGGFSAEVVAGDFGFGIAPADDNVTDGRGGQFGLSFGAADTQAGGLDAVMQLVAAERLTWALPAAFDDVDHSVHQKPPVPILAALTTWLI